MRLHGGRAQRVTRARTVRALSAAVLVLSISSTGLVALAAPASAAPPAPAPAITASPTPAVNNLATPSWGFGVPTTTYECAFGLASPTAPPYSPCTSPFTAPALTTDGVYRFWVREVMAGGSLDATSDYTYDTVGKVTLGAPASPGNNPLPHWDVQTEPGGSATCSFDGAPAVTCTTGFTAATPLTVEGPHVLTVQVLDALNNPGTATSTYVLDLTPPPAPTVTGSAGRHNTPTVSWSWTPGAGETSLCKLTSPAGVAPAVQCDTGTFAQPVTTEGDYSLSVVVSDVAGNASPPGGGPIYTYDKTPPPAPVFVTAPPSTATDRTPTWTFTTPGVSTTCQLVGAVAGSRAPVACDAGSLTAPTLLDDSWTLTVTTSDIAGNASSTTSAAYLLDTTGPAGPVVVGPTGPGNNPLPHFTWTGELPSTAECRLVRTDALGTTLGPWLRCDARFFDPVLSGDADYRVETRLTDPLGNLGATGTSGTYSYDGTAPVQPVVFGPPAVSNDPAPTFTFTPEVGGTASCRFLRGAITSPWTACSGGSYQPSLPGEGTFVVEVVVTDAAGNPSPTGSRSYTLDLTAPGAPTITPPVSPSNSRAPSWGIAGDGASTLTCRLLSGGTPVAASVACTSGYLGDLTGKADGIYVFEVTATDVAGNTTASTNSYVLDTLAPSPAVISGPVSPGNAFSPAWTFPVQPQTTAQCRLVQGLSVSAWSDCSIGQYTVSALADGTYTVDVLVTDLAGNNAPLATSNPYTSDRTVPGAPAVSGPSGPGKDPTPSWTWTGEPGATATCRLDRAGVVGTAVACNSGTFSPGLTGDTSYVVVVQLRDAAGNVSPSTTTAAYVLDTAAPAAPVITGPTGPSNNSSPVWSWTAEAGAITDCRLVRNGTAGTWGSCTSGVATTLPSDGVYVLQVRATDAAANTSAVASSAPYTYDATAPVAPVVTAPASPSNVLVPSYTFTSEALAVTQCRLLRAGALVRDWVNCTSPVSIDLTGLPDASYVVDVRVTDAAGNTSLTGAALPYLLDTTAPDPPTVSGPPGPSTNSSPTFTWTGEANTTATCRLVHDGVMVTLATACASPWNPTLTGDGQWSIRIRLGDAAGNRSLPGLSGIYVLDTTPPTAPVITPPPSPGRDAAPSWAAAVEPGSSSECHLAAGDGTVLADWAPCTLPVTTDLSARPDGLYVLAVRSTDAVGLTGPAGSASYLLDTTAPPAPSFTAMPASPSRLRSVSFSFTAEPGASVTCRLTSGSTVISPDTPCTSPLPVSFTGLPDGAYTLSATATDAAGNVGAAQTATYVLDTTAPAAPVLVTGPAATAPDRTPTWAFTAESGATVTCRVTGAISGVVLPDTTCTSPFSVDLTNRADDTYTLTARATDAAGNTGAALTSSYILDATAPTTADVVGPPSPGKVKTPTWQVSSAEGTVQCHLVKGATLVRDWGACGPTFTPNLAGFADGLYVLTARVVDTAGNLSAEVTSRYVLDTTPPAPAVLTTPASPSNDRSPTWTVSSPDPAVTAECEVTGPLSNIVRPFAPCPVSVAGSPYNLDVTGAQDGPWTLVVRLTDTAGNTGAEARGVYVLDTVAPSSVLVVAPKSPSANVTPTWTLTGDSDAVLECRLSGPGLTGAFVPCAATPGVPGNGSFTANLTTRADGTYTLGVRSRDAAGNLGPETTSGYVIDRVAPVLPDPPVASSPSPSQYSVITWDFTVEQGATALCTLSSATAVVAPEQACASPWSTDLGQYGDGDYALSVRAQDAAGNSSGSVSTHYVLDRTPPAAPSITNSLGSPSPNPTPTWGVQASDNKDLLECQLLGTAKPTWAACSGSVGFDLGTATSGVYRLQVRETDAAGNVSAMTSSLDYVLDRTAPAPPDVFAPDPSRSNDTRPVFHIVRQPGDDTDHLVCIVTRFDGGTATASPCAFGNSTVDLSGLRGDGPVVLTVVGVDVLGNTSGKASATYAFDDVAPVSPTLLGPDPDASFTRTVEWTFGDVPDADHYVCELRKPGETGPLPLLTCSSPHQVTLQVFGTHTFSVWAVDKAGNQSTAAATSLYSLLPPVPQLPAPRAPAPGPGPTPTWTFSVPRTYSAICLVSDANGTTLSVGDCTRGIYTVDLTDKPGGVYTLSVQLTDSHGNAGIYSSGSNYRYTPNIAQDGHLGQPGPPNLPPGRPGPGVRPPVTPPGPGTVPGMGPGTGPGTVPGTGGGSPTVVVNHPPSGARSLGSPTDPAKTLTAPRFPALPSVLPSLDHLPQAIKDSIAGTLERPTIPLLLLVVVVGFLLLQNQIDRRDPKLASAPVGAEPELDFGPVLGKDSSVSRTWGGGAPA